MTVRFLKTPRQETSEPVEYIDNGCVPIDDDNTRAQGIIREVINVNAVAGLRNLILAQQDRCTKLADHEFMFSGVLPEYSKELRLLKDLYGDVIKFQTNAGVMKLLQQGQGGPGSLADEIDNLEQGFTIQNQIADATIKAMAILNVTSPSYSDEDEC
jgi:hypothetical protein